MRSRQIGLIDIVSVRFIDDDAIGHLHNPALDTLKFIPVPASWISRKKSTIE